MRTPPPLLGSLLFVLIGPLLEVGVGPWLLTGFETADGLPGGALQVLGVVLVAAGGAVLVHAFARFVVDGTGTPSPLAPPRRLVVAGAYRHVRHPMYVATAAVIAGEGLLLRQSVLLIAAAAFLLAMAALSRFAEDPLLERRFGREYAAYRAAVPGWLPRLRPWQGSSPS